MAAAKKCDICGKYYDEAHTDVSILRRDKGVVEEKDICSECSDLIEAFVDSIKEGSTAVGLLDYLISVYGEKELKEMLKENNK